MIYCYKYSFKNLNHSVLRKIISKYCNRKTLDESTLWKYYISILYNKAFSSIRYEIFAINIWAAFDETTDAQARYIACFVVRALYRDKPKTFYFLNEEIFERTKTEMFYN